MRKYLFVLFTLAIVFNINVNSTNAANCAPGELFNTSTGQSCTDSNRVVGCKAGYLFSPVTGQRCPEGEDGSSSQEDVGLSDTLFKRELAVGSKGEDVKAVQQILKDGGFLSGTVDGSYGPITKGAVVRYQANKNINPTGKVDTDTLREIKRIPWYRMCPLINKTYGVEYPCPPAPTSLVISGVSGPQSLNPSQQGSWTVKAYDANGGNLSYTVVWGDESYLYPQGQSSVRPFQQSATFEHSYSLAGIYTPIFTVKNDSGQSAKTSLSVKVGDVTSNVIYEKVKCVFNGSVTQEKCWGDYPNVGSVTHYSCTGIETCVVSVSGPKGTPVTWGSSCGGSANTKIDGDNEYANFSCVDDSLSIKVTSPNGGETWQKGTTQTIKWQYNTTTSTTCQIGLPCPSPTYDIFLNGQESCSYDMCTTGFHAYTIAKGVNGFYYEWPVGKNSTTYPDRVPDGAYSIEVCQSGANICDSSDSYFKISSVSSTNSAPKIITSSVPVNNIQPGQSVSFSWTATDPDSDDLSWSINWGDDSPGSSNCSTIRRQTGTGWTYSASHKWANPGMYKVGVTVTDCVGGVDQNVFTITVGNTTQASTVVGRWIFYNNSAFDVDGDSSASPKEKKALMPGETATFANYTSFSKGINGIMIDLSPGVAHDAINAEDFEFKVGNDNSPAGWSEAPEPTSVTIKKGQGSNDSDRVLLIWSDNAIQKQWLQVTVKANANTGLVYEDVFYFGNAIGETNDLSSQTLAVVNGIDEARIRANPRNFTNPAPIDFAFDINRDKMVDLEDEMMARNNGTTSSTALKFISVPQ